MLRILRRVLLQRRDAARLDEDARVAIEAPQRHAEEPKPSSQTPLKVLKGHTDDVNGLAFFPDGRRFVSGSWDRSLIIWDVTAGEVEKKLTGDTHNITSVAMAHDGSVFASGSSDGTVRFWDGTNGNKIGEPIDTHPTGPVGVWGLAFSPDSRRVATTGNDTVKIWDVLTRASVTEPLCVPSGGYTVAFSHDGSRIAAYAGGGSVGVWDSLSGEVVFDSLKGHTKFVRWTAFTPDGRQLVTASCDKTICRWDMKTGVQIGKPLTGHSGWIYDGVISRDGNTLATASDDRTVRFWDLKTGNQKSRFLKHQFPVWRVALSRDGSLLATASGGNKVRIWDMKAVEAEFDEEVHDEAEAINEQNPPSVPQEQGNAEQGREQDPLKMTCEEDRRSETSSTRQRLDMLAVGFSVSGAAAELSHYDREGDFWKGFNHAGPSDAIEPGKVQPGDGAIALDPSSRRRRRMFKHFFDNSSRKAPPQVLTPIDERPKKRSSKFRAKFTRKKGPQGAEPQTRPERQQVVPGQETESPFDPQPGITTKVLTEKGKGKQKESNSSPAPTGTGPSATSSPEPRPSAPASHTKRHFRHRVNRIRQPRIRPERPQNAYDVELRDRPIFAYEIGPLPDEIERGCCFHFWSYICFGQRDPNINPDQNVAPPTAQPSPSDARTHLRSLGPLDRLSLWLRLRKPPAPVPTAASPSTNVQSTSSPHTGPDASIPLEPPPPNAITSRVDATEVAATTTANAREGTHREQIDRRSAHDTAVEVERLRLEAEHLRIEGERLHIEAQEKRAAHELLVLDRQIELARIHAGYSAPGPIDPPQN